MRYKILIALLILPLAISYYATRASALNSYYVIILSDPFGYTSPGAGTYLHWQDEPNLKVYAYPYAGYYFAGWYIDGVLYNEIGNPMEIVFQGASGNRTIKPFFSSQPYYSLTLTSPDNVYVYVNEQLTPAAGLTLQMQGGRPVTVTYPSTDWYLFQNYLVNGTTTITSNTYTFTINGNTTIHVNETYVSGPSPGAVPTLIQVLVPGLIIGALGGSFWKLGDRMGDHGNAGFIIGGTMGMIMSAMSGLIPMWLLFMVFTFGGVGFYFWFKRGS